MWKIFKCRFFRDHDYDVRRAPGALFLQCKRCGSRSQGWNLLGGRVNRSSPTPRPRLVLAESPDVFRAAPVAVKGAAIASPFSADVPEMRLKFSQEP
jgi:hypothetical protein